MVCSCSLGAQVLGFPGWCRSVLACVLPGVTQCELQSNLQMVATFAGLAVSQVVPNYDPKLAAATAGPGATHPEGGGLGADL